ncbi:hypothetical protein AMR42_18860 [Limnothrix sp. PR1529]|nr:hypothetical protein AMR42_18860 [Limnothrix sp. PR1529]
MVAPIGGSGRSRPAKSRCTRSRSKVFKKSTTQSARRCTIWNGWLVATPTTCIPAALAAAMPG